MTTIIIFLITLKLLIYMFLSFPLYVQNTFYLKQIDYVDSTFKVRNETRRQKDNATAPNSLKGLSFS